MPIRRDQRHHYSREVGWGKLRLEILDRAKGRCERCGVLNHATGYRDAAGAFHEVASDAEAMEAAADRRRLFKIVLTIAHLDQNPANRDLTNLAALCQRCHLRHDSKQHADNASRTRAKKRAVPGQQGLFDDNAGLWI